MRITWDNLTISGVIILILSMLFLLIGQEFIAEKLGDLSYLLLFWGALAYLKDTL